MSTPVEEDGAMMLGAPTIIQTSNCGRYIAKDTGVKEAALQIYQVQQPPVLLCEIPRWSSDLFAATRLIQFVVDPSCGETRIVASPDVSQLAVYNLAGSMLYQTGTVSDYITQLDLVAGGRFLVVSSILWHPISRLHLVDVHELLSRAQHGVITCDAAVLFRMVWDEDYDSNCYPTITETHVELSPRQRYTWEHMYQRGTADSISLQPESVVGDIAGLALEIVTQDDEHQTEVVVVSQNKSVVGRIPFVSPSIRNPFALLGAFAKGVDSPLVVTLLSPTRLGVWSLTGKLLAQSKEWDSTLEARRIQLVSESTMLRVLLHPIHDQQVSDQVDATSLLFCFGNLNLSANAEWIGAICRFGNTESSSRITSFHDRGVSIDGNDSHYLSWRDLSKNTFEDVLLVHDKSHWPSSYLHHLMARLLESETTATTIATFGQPQPPADTLANAEYRGADLSEEPLSTVAEIDTSEEHKAMLQKMVRDFSSGAVCPPLRVFGTGSRIIMPQFERRLRSASGDGSTEARESYAAFFGEGAKTKTGEMDLSVLIGERLLLRFRLKQELIIEEAVSLSNGWYGFDPTAILEIHVGNLAGPYALYRDTSMYTEPVLLLSVCSTYGKAERAKAAYLAHIKERGDVFHFQQGYQDVDLTHDLVISRCQLDYLPKSLSFTLKPNKRNFGTPTSKSPTRLFVLHGQAECMGQISRGESALFTDTTLRARAKKEAEEAEQDESFPNYFLYDELELDTLRMRNLDVSDGEKTAVQQVRQCLDTFVSGRVRVYKEAVNHVDRMCRDPLKRDASRFVSDHLPLLMDKLWPGSEALERAHGTILVWLSQFDASPSDTLMDVLGYLNDLFSQSKSRETTRDSRKHRLALAYMLDEFTSKPVA